VATPAPTTRIGLALGSGASRGWSHIGVIKALLKEGIEPDVICGTSVGAIIGGSYVAGNLDKLEKWVLGSTRSDVLRFFDISISKSGFVDSDRLNWFLTNYVAADDTNIEALSKKFAAVSTNLDTGREVWFTEGKLTDAVRASMAMPGLFPAVRIDHRWLVDGGLVNPVPVSTCRALGADIVIAVNPNSDIIGKRNDRKEKPAPREANGMLGSIRQTAKEYSESIFPNRTNKDATPGLFYAIANSVNIFQDRITRSRLAGDPADVLITPRVAQIGMLEFHRAEEAISEGELCVSNALSQVKRLIESG
jgi:NTE family protein